MPQVLLFTNTVAPYRLPVFEHLAINVDLSVAFARGKTADRQWDSSLDAFSFRHTILPHRLLRFGGSSLVINPSVLKFLSRVKYDTVVLGDNRETVLSNFLIGTAAHIYRRPLVVWTGITPGEATVTRSKRWLRRMFDRFRLILLRRASAVVAYGTITRQHLVELGISEDKIFVGTQVVPKCQLPPPSFDKRSLGLDGKNVVLSVNYLVSRKGIASLIMAFQRVYRENDILALVGSGPEEKRLRNLADRDVHILFPGYQSGSDKTAWYAAADVFAFPTLHDPWGLVVNEAMAFGLPIIATDAAGCVPDLIQDNGLVVPAGDVDALAQALNLLLRDETLRKTMGSRSRETISDYTVENATKTFLDAIHFALGK